MDQEQKRLAEELLFQEKKAPSFGKQLYFGLFDTSHVYPYPHVSAEQEADTNSLIQQLNTFADQNIDPKWIDSNATIPDNVIEGLGKLGILGITVPKEYGGLGMTQYAYCRATEALASRCASTALFVNAHQSIGVKALLLFGTPEQRNKWLPALAKGEQIAAFSLTEPNAGSDAAGIETIAVYDPQRNVYRLTGKKQWTTSGSIARVLTVMAKTEVDTPKGKEYKVTAFLVTPDMPGFSITAPALEKVGMRGTKTANLAFNDMEVPAENILGPIGGGLRVCLTALDYGRTTFGATCTGASKFLVARAIAHARSRYQFKRPLASFGLVKQKIANMSALAYAMDATTYMTAGLIDAKVEDVMLESAMLKVFASDSLWSIIYDTMQIFGGRSFFNDEPFERMMRDARLNMIGEGANEVLRAFIGAVGMRDVGIELQEVVEALQHPWSDFPRIWNFGKEGLKRWQTARLPVQSPLLQRETKALRRAVRRFGISVVKVLARYREEILEKQMVLDRIATSAMAIYTTTAVLSKLDSDLTRVNGNADALGNDVAVAKLYCQQAMQTLDQCLRTLFPESDSDIEAVSDQITGIK
ncbi:MAG: acyl-CoA dehydrogenase family protein [Parachlamydiaceae bacterium]|nr:acyl-CoA dehydrogenase family protein [Parachlamydiaceae bacterium]